MYDRRKSIGASDAVHIKAGDWPELYDQKHGVGVNEWPLAAAIGKELESFHRFWYELQTGRDVRFNDRWRDAPLFLHGPGTEPLASSFSPLEWNTYTPDGLITTHDPLDGGKTGSIPWEAKAINMMWKPHNLLKKYNPQLQHAMRIMRADHCIFSVIYLNVRWEQYTVEYDEPYADELFRQEQAFLWYLENEVRP